ncbi:MAG: glycerate kinase [Chloroflexi bacterium]|nr:glycerate kinase [Chloroflexota bacterium]
MRAADPKVRLLAHLPILAASLEQARHCWVIGIGKAALEMALALESQLGQRLAGGAVAAPPERLAQVDEATRRALPFQLYPAAHPLPDERNLLAAQAIARIATQVGAGDLVIALVSGGGSAHLTLPVAGLTLADLQITTDALLKSGATIQELNAVRKHCEQLKGGGLLRLIAPARVQAFILSDVIGDPLDVIASGSVSPDPTTYADALKVLDKYGLAVDAVRRHLTSGENETLKPGDPLLALVSHTIIGSNLLAVEAVEAAAKASGFAVACVETGVQGEAREVGQRIGTLARQWFGHTRPQCIIFGGETTVMVRGNGLGGRNQELALAAAIAMNGFEKVALAAFATDGIDGPTPAAGAYVTGETCERARALGLDPARFLNRNDSHTFFARLDDLILTGPTGTNVNDVAVALMYST